MMLERYIECSSSSFGPKKYTSASRFTRIPAGRSVCKYVSPEKYLMFVGRVTPQIRKYHAIMLEMQQEAISSLKVGGKFSDIDRVVVSMAKMKDVSQLLLHHTGHCIGLEGHESPFFDVGDDSPIRANMVFTIEPGIYVPKLGGFRHSDTIIMHEDGPEVITYYPNNTDDLIVI